MTGAENQDLRARFFDGMSHAACTVNVVTTDGAAGRAGVTVSAMASVSADTPKPTLLVCVHHLSPAAPAVLENQVFCVNVLRDDQSYISDAFAGRFKDQIEDKFDCTAWTVQITGAPRVVDPLVAFDCRLVSHERVGTHYVFFGEVEDVFTAGRGSPLLYANRAYGATERIEAAESIAAGAESAGAKLSAACLHTFGPYVLPRLISRLQSETGGFTLNLIEGDQRKVQQSLLAGESEIGLLYDLGLDGALTLEPLTVVRPYVLLAEGHALAEKDVLTPRDLAGHPMILLNAPPSRDYFLSIMENAGVTPDVAFKSTSFETVRGLAGHGLGYALLGTKPVSAVTYDGKALVTRPLDTKTEASPLVLAYRTGARLSDLAAAFVKMCREEFTAAH
ncbi:MAG: LysR substrate-binding domain-containing protein [Rhodospirillales bacterium]